jgi:hemerythrin-like metal-binding protein
VPSFMWNPAWETGIQRIDVQHQGLLAQFEKLLMAIHENHAADRMPGLLTFLADYVETHFSTEEEYMRMAHYPGFPGHKAIHDDLRAKVAHLAEGYRLNPAVVTEEVVDFLTDWLVRHINEEDRSMAQFLVRFNSGGTQTP